MAKTSLIWGRVLFFLLYLLLYFGGCIFGSFLESLSEIQWANSELKVLEIMGLMLWTALFPIHALLL